MEKNKKVSVITVCLNCVDTIALTLESVKAQTYESIEHVVIDGGSADGTVDIVKKHNVDYFVSEPDEGIYHAMEKGAKASTGDILIFLNSGDLFYDKNVCTDVAAFFRLTGAKIVFGDFCPWLINPNDAYDHNCFYPGQICRLNDVKNRGCLKNRNIHHQAIFYSKDVFDKCSFFSPEWPNGSDYEFNVQALVEHGFSAKYFPRVVSKFALGGVSTTNFKKELKSVSDLTKIINNKYFKKPKSYDEVEYVHIPDSSESVEVKKMIKSLSFYRLIQGGGRRIVALFATLITRFLTQGSSFQNIIENFYERSDSIYGAIVGGRDEFNKRSDSIYGAVVEFNKRFDSIYGAIMENRNQSEMVTSAIRENISGLQDRIEKQQAYFEQLAGATQALMAEQRAIDINTARLLNAQQKDETDFRRIGYRVTSQFDEDGIIQYLIRHMEIPNPVFVEFGVESYKESNTRLLVEKDNWSGLVMDCVEDYIRQIQNSPLCWRHNLQAICATANVSNINDLIAGAGITGDIGLLSIDIDGVDYWVWKAVEGISPRIVVCEYNSIFGWEAMVTVPYDPEFNRLEKHYSGVYGGASMAALAELGKDKGYSLVASNIAGNNAFFVRNDCLNNIKTRTVKEVYIKAQFRESRDLSGNLTYLPMEEAIKKLGELPVYDLQAGRERKIKEIKINYV